MAPLRILSAAFIAAIAWSGACAATGLIPVQADSGSALPEYIRQVVTGAPADSVVLRVSLCAIDGDGRIDTKAFIIVEELKWPRPRPEYRIDIEGVPAVSRGEAAGSEWLLRSSRIPGAHLNQARRDIAPPAPPAGSRAGELNGHLLRPFEFVAWLSPLKFVVDDGRARYVIERVGLGEYELVEVARWQ